MRMATWLPYSRSDGTLLLEVGKCMGSTSEISVGLVWKDVGGGVYSVCLQEVTRC